MTVQIVQTGPSIHRELPRRRRRRPDHRLRQPAARVLPLQPLLDVTGFSRRKLSEIVRRSGHDVAQAARIGLTVEQACTWADRCRLHPTEVWGTAWWEVAA